MKSKSVLRRATVQVSDKVINEIFKLRKTLLTIENLIGNIDHTKGHGPCASRLRGELLTDIREIVKQTLEEQG